MSESRRADGPRRAGNSGARWLLGAAAAAAAAGTLHVLRNRAHLPHLREPGLRPSEAVERVAVLVPARNEAATIGRCVADLLAQVGVPDLRIRVLDDNSSDETAARAESAADGDPRVRVLRSQAEPPPGWLGKAWACHQLAEVALGGTGESPPPRTTAPTGPTGSAAATVLVFVDADVRLRPGAVAAGVASLRSRGLGLMSCWPRQAASSPLARLVQPLQQWSWMTTLPLRAAERGRDPRMAAANGQFLVIDAGAYRDCDGHRGVRGLVLEDIALARSVKASGHRTGIADAAAVAECMMYADDSALVTGYAKSLWTAFGGPRRGIAVAAGLVAVYAAPVAGLLSRDPVARGLAASALCAGAAGRALSAGATGGRTWPDALAHPVSVTAFAALMLESVRRHRAGRIEWRGRVLT